MQTSLSVPPRTAWVVWAALFVVVYFGVTIVGWKRTPIDTEVWAWYFAAQPFDEQLQTIRGDFVHPPLMYLLERLWIALFGQTHNAAKALPVVVNLPTLFLFTWLASRVTPHWRLAAVLFSGMYWQVGSEQNQIRMYGLQALLAVLAIVLWERWRQEPTYGRLVAWTTVLLLLLYTHMCGSWILLAFLVASWLYGPRKAAFTIAAGLAGLLFLPWLFYVYPVYQARGLQWNVGWVSRSPLRALAEVPFIFLGSYAFPLNWGPRLVVNAAAVLLHLLLFLVAWRMIRLTWPPKGITEPTARWFWTAAVLVGIPVLFLLFISVAVTPAFHARFVYGVLPAYWLAIVLLGQFGGRSGRVMLYGIFLPWVLASAGAALVRGWKPSDARQAANLVASEMGTKDMLLCTGVAECPQLYWEWHIRLGRRTPLEILTPPPHPKLSQLPEMGKFYGLPTTDLEQLTLENVERVWIFYDIHGRLPEVSDFLSSRQFTLGKRIPADKPFLLMFVKSPQS